MLLLVVRRMITRVLLKALFEIVDNVDSVVREHDVHYVVLLAHTARATPVHVNVRGYVHEHGLAQKNSFAHFAVDRHLIKYAVRSLEPWYQTLDLV